MRRPPESWCSVAAWSAIVTAERDHTPTTPVAMPTRSVCRAAAVAGPNESPNVISGNHAVSQPAASARPAKSIVSAGGSPVRKSPGRCRPHGAPYAS